MSGTRDSELLLEIAAAMVEELEDYLLGDSLYRQLVVETSAGDRMPNMSAGSLLEMLRDLEYADEAGQLTPDQSSRLASLRGTVERVADQYAAAYHQKLARELKSQIDSWRWFLQDCHDDPLQCRDEYPTEVRIRNRLALLMDALGDDAPDDQVVRLQRLDGDLRDLWSPGEFILDEALQNRYPKNRYWWLYGRPGGAD